MLSHDVVADTRRLAAALRDNKLPGQRSMTAITRLRRERGRHRFAPATRTPAERLRRSLLDRYTAEIARRGGETTVDSASTTYRLNLNDRDPGQRMALLHVAGWRRYGHTGHRWVDLSYLCGVDDNGPWAVRVPGTVTTVADALFWITPAVVRTARAEGRRVDRQGDVYAIERSSPRGDGAGELPTGHTWDPATRTLIHTPTDGRAHAPLHLPYPVLFVPQRVYQMGRSGGRANGD